MDIQDLREIIRIQSEDLGVELTEQHYNDAINYYHTYGNIPEINYIIDQNNQNNIIQNVLAHLSNNNHPPINNGEEDNNEEEDDEEEDNDEQGDIEDNDNRQNNGINWGRLIPNEQNPDNIRRIGSNLIISAFTQFVNNHLNNENERDMDEQISGRPRIRIINPNNFFRDVTKVVKNVDDVKISVYNNQSDMDSQCYLCYDEFICGDILRILDCGHCFHRCCVDTHLKKISNACPFCKKECQKETIFSNI